MEQQPLDLLSAHTAILDTAGTIVEVNRAWRRFGIENGLNSPAAGVGLNYLEICKSDGNDDHAVRALTALEQVLAGRMHQDAFIYPCHSPAERRWFACRILPYGRSGLFLALHFRSPSAIRARRLIEPLSSTAGNDGTHAQTVLRQAISSG